MSAEISPFWRTPSASNPANIIFAIVVHPFVQELTSSPSRNDQNSNVILIFLRTPSVSDPGNTIFVMIFILSAGARIESEKK